jgi:hypothetical protein
MNSRVLIALVTAAAGMMFSGEISAHHSTAAEFDAAKPITFSGTVKKVEWLNPHIYVHVQTQGADGTAVVYRVEGGPPNALYRQGWRMDSLKAGDSVTVKGVLAKNESSMHIGQATITTPDGKRVFSGSGPRRAEGEP